MTPPPRHDAHVRDGTYCMDMKTLQSGTIKTLVEGMKDILNDTVIEFDHTGMKIVALNTAQNVMVHLHLYADALEYYYCDRTHRVGINMLNLHKLIKATTTNHTLTLFLESSDMNNLGIKLENSDRSQKTTYKLRTMDLNQPFTVPHMEFHKTITMHSPFFQKICRDMNGIAEFVEIKDVKNQLIFTCEGDFCSQETILCDNKNSGIHAPCAGSAGDNASSYEDETDDGEGEGEDEEEGENEEGDEEDVEGSEGDEEEEDSGREEQQRARTKHRREGSGSEMEREGGGRKKGGGGKNAKYNGTAEQGKKVAQDNSNSTHTMSSSTIPGTAGDDAPEIVQGVFSLKYLSMFTKFTNLSNTVDLLMKNDFPLLVRYPVSSLGEIKLLLSEKDSDENDDVGADMAY